MNSLLVIHSSGRIHRSITRQLTARFSALWEQDCPGAETVERDLAIHPPSFVNEAWIAAAYHQPAATRTPEMIAALAESETLIAEIERATAIVIGAPMYNFGMPALLKAYFEQIIRSGRTFAFNSGDPIRPYLPLLTPKPVTVITSTGAGGYEPGAVNAAINFLEAPLLTSLSLIGLTDVQFIRISHAGDRSSPAHAASLARAEQAVDSSSNWRADLPVSA